jgi:GT2 family glycosyltransferase
VTESSSPLDPEGESYQGQPDPDDFYGGTDADVPEVQGWGSLEEEFAAEPVMPRRSHFVTAVVVAHDGDVWLPAVLTTLGRQTRPMNAIVGIDSASKDSSAEMLRESLGDDAVVTLETDKGFGAAAAAGIDHAGSRISELGDDVVRWIWFLHDDSAPDPTCLERLLETADNHPSAVVLGPKILGWHDRRLLLEAGVTINADGRRVTGLERREHDQGQHDGVRDVMAVSSAGMLVREDVWEELGGFDPNLPLYRDDLDLCWRVHRAGGRVLIATDAVLHHREASAHGRREVRDANERPHRADREAAVRVLLAHSRPLVAPFVALRLLVGSVLRSVVYLIGKDFRAARDEVGAVAAVAFRPRRIAKSRELIARTSTEPASVTRSLRPTSLDQLREAGEAVGGLLTTSSSAAPSSISALESGPVDDEAVFLQDDSSGFLRRFFLKPSVVMTIALLVTAVFATRALWWGEGVLQGGALLPVPQGASDLWATYFAAWHDVGPGSTTPSAPYLIVVASLASVLFGNPDWAMNVLVLLAAPIAGWSAYFASRGMVTSKLVRAWMGFTYALLPAMTGAIEQGRIGTLMTAIVLPFAIRSGVRLARRSGTMRRAAGTALMMSVILAATPAVWVVSVVIGVSASIVAWRRLRSQAWGIIVRFLIALLVPLVVLMPWTLHLVTNPVLFFVEPGLNIPGIVDPDLRPVDILLVHPGGPGMNPLWVTAGLLFASLLALFRRDTIANVGAWWILGLLALAVGVVQASITVLPPGDRIPVQPWPGPMTLLLGLAMIAVAGIAVEGLRERFAGQNFTLGQPLAVIALIAALVTPIAAAVWWIPATDDVLVRASRVDVPAFVAAEANGPQAPRTLVLSDNGLGEVRYTLLGGSALALGDAETAPPADVWQPIDEQVAALASGRGGGEVDALRSYGVRYVKLAPSSSRSIVPALDSEPGLRRLASAEGEVLWRIGGVTSRAQVLDIDSATGDFLPAAVELAQPGDIRTDPYLNTALPEAIDVEPGSKVLWIGSTATHGWSASIDGQALAPAELPEPLNWSAAFVVPADSSTAVATASFEDSFRQGWLILQGIVIVVLIVLALPERRVIDPDPDDPDDPTTGEAPHFLYSTDLHRPQVEENPEGSVSDENESEVPS